MEEFMYQLKIPKDRIAVLIGKEGCIKRDIEAGTKTALEVDSKEGDVSLKGKDALGLYAAREIVRAVGRGFNPDVAMLLLKVDYLYETIDLTEYVGKSKNHLDRIRGRIIGREGRSRALIEELSETYVVVYGKSVGIIGLGEGVDMARTAIEMLLKGSNHSGVFTMLERKRRDLRKSRLMGVDSD